MRSRLPILIAALAIAITAMIAAGCGSDDSTTSSSGSDATASSGSFSTITEGTLLIGTDAPYPPFEIGTPPTPTSAAMTSTSPTTSPTDSG